MIGRSLRFGISVLAVMVASESFAENGRVAVTPKVGTLGLGADVSVRVAGRVSLRMVAQQFVYDWSGRVDGVDYDADLDLQSIGTLVDVFPASGRFRLTAGLLANGNELSTVARLDPTTSYDIGLGSFTGAELGDVDGHVTFARAAPFAAVGWGNPFVKQRRLGFSADVGFVYQPIEDAELRSSNPLGDPLLDQQMENEERRFEDEVARLEWYPVVTLGLSVRF